MKLKIKYFVLDNLFKVYYPLMLRKEKMKAASMWRDGVRLCKKMQKELVTPRVYLFFDANHMVWSPMTYEPNKKFKPSVRQLRIMGKMHGSEKIRNVEDMKRYSFYYTDSKWGAKGCHEENALRTEKLGLWITYYLGSLSDTMKKLRDYRQGFEERRSAGR